MKICVIGSGYVGLVTGSCLADLGNTVICVDNDLVKVRTLNAGAIPIHEPGLKEMIKRNKAEGRISFTSNIKAAVKKSEIIFISVNTPPKENGEADLSFVERVSKDVALSMPSYRLIVEKSTVPVNTGEWIERTIKTFNKRGIKFDVASNPEFLREGSAINDFMHPDRIVIGVKSRKAGELLTRLYKPLKAPIVVTDIKAAELIKHASNSFLAMKISFINAISNICDMTGADVNEVSRGIGLDSRIGDKFLSAGAGFGGSCFPKDLDAFIRIAEKSGYDFALLKEVQRINESQKELVVKKIEETIWNLQEKTVAVLGLAFKPNTDDIRRAPSLDIIGMLLKEGAKVRAYDPAAMPKVKAALKKSVVFCRDAYETARGADCIVIMTEWNEFRQLDLKRLKSAMRQPVIIDARNVYDPARVRALGFKYMGMGRK